MSRCEARGVLVGGQKADVRQRAVSAWPKRKAGISAGNEKIRGKRGSGGQKKDMGESWDLGAQEKSKARRVWGVQRADVVLAVAAARAPPQHLKEVAGDAGHNDEEEGDLRFRLPPDAPTWQRQLAAFLRLQVGLPDVVLIILFGVRRRSWLVLAVWMVGWPLAARLEVGPTVFASPGALRASATPLVSLQKVLTA